MKKIVPINEYTKETPKRNITAERNKAKIKAAKKIEVPIATFNWDKLANFETSPLIELRENYELYLS